MLDAQDLRVLEEMLVKILSRTEEKFEKKFTEIDEWFNGIDERFNGIDERFNGIDERFNGIDERFIGIDQRFIAMDEKIDSMEVMILDELERTREILDKRIDKVQQDIDEMKQYYKIAKLEDRNQALLQDRVDDLDKRVRKMEEKTA